MNTFFAMLLLCIACYLVATVLSFIGWKHLSEIALVASFVFGFLTAATLAS